jgi:hypothetical protein
MLGYNDFGWLIFKLSLFIRPVGLPSLLSSLIGGMDWIFSLTLLICSMFWFLKICHRDFCHLSFFYQIQLDMAKKEVVLTISMDKWKKMYISDFWFLKICHRDFCQTYWEFFENWEIMKIDHFLSHFSTRYS